MFGGAKSTFGTGTNTTGFGGFTNTTTSTPFGQSAFGKPATPAFGAAPTFGTQQTTPSLFGQPANTAQPTGLFGATTTSTAFGATTAPQTSFGGFSQTPQNTSIFGAQQNPANTLSLFGQPTTSAFGSAVKPGGLTGFGQAATAQPTTSLFGQATTSAATTGFGAFGQTGATTSNVFGSGQTSAFGQPQAAANVNTSNLGTSIAKYQPTPGTDTLMKSGQPNNINTKQHCITAMKEYELKSLEELRMEDYLVGRKGPQAGTTTSGFFGGTAGTSVAPASTGLFGSTAQPNAVLFGQSTTTGTENKGLFGQTTFGQSAATNAFGANAQQNNFLAKPFGATNTTAFGATTTDASNPFGAKPAFGQPQATGLFGQTTATSAATGFGQTTTGFGGFGANTGTQQTSLFGQTNTADANKSAFGLGTAASTANTGFGGFGAPATSTAGGLFGAKPTTGFGATPAFGATSTANTGFGSVAPAFGTQTNSLFNTSLNKPQTNFGGFGTATSTAPLNFNASGSLFGNTAAKPGGLFGTTGTLGNTTNQTGGGGLFNSSASAFGTSNALGGGFGSIGGNNALSGGMGGAPQQNQYAIPIHQQILAKVTSPYGDTPIFKDLRRNDENDPLRATNPAAQKAIIDSTTRNYKVQVKPLPSSVKIKPLGNSKNQKTLFDGLENLDSNPEHFHLKPSAKRLVLRLNHKNTSNSSPSANSNDQTAVIRRQPYNEAIPVEPQPIPESTVPPSAIATAPKDADTTRRESWLHPNNLEKVRQQNLQSGSENSSPLNSTLNELVPRKPIESYRPSPTRLSISAIPENPFEDQEGAVVRAESINFNEEQANESHASQRSFENIQEQQNAEEIETEGETHPTGIILKRAGYYTIPTLDDMLYYLTEDGTCIVPNFTVGREGYGNVFFAKELDVKGLNLDEIVHFRNKEVIIYPDDDNKPPVGSGLNREAQVTLDQVWPLDKTTHEPIKDAKRLQEMDWEGKLRRNCNRSDTRFIDYRPETGSWVFRVKHFSKFGFDDSDEDDNPTDPKKAKLNEKNVMRANMPMPAGDKALVNAQANLNISGNTPNGTAHAIPGAGFNNSNNPMDETAELMYWDKSQCFQMNGSSNFLMYDNGKNGFTSPTGGLAKTIGNRPQKVQLMKSSLFFDGGNEETPVRHNKVQLGKRVFSYIAADDLNDIAISENSSQYDFAQFSPALPASSSPSIISLAQDLQSRGSTPEPENEIVIPPKNDEPVAIRAIFQIQPETAPMRCSAETVPIEQCIAYDMRDKWYADLGIYRSRAFKLSFGPQNILIVPTTQKNLPNLEEHVHLRYSMPHIFKVRGIQDYTATILQRVQITATQHCEQFKESILPHLEIQLAHRRSNTVDDSDCPWLEPIKGTELIVKHLEESINMVDIGESEQYSHSVWSLLLALWGNQEELEGQEANQHFAIMYRRSLLSEWLEQTVFDKEILNKQIKENTYLEHLNNLIMCHRVNDANELAFKHDDEFLAFIIASLSGGPVVRQTLQQQLRAWVDTNADKYIHKERLKIYMMAAGVPLYESSIGLLNIFEDFNWIKVLALQLWYFTSPTASITDALLAYDKTFKMKEVYAEAPTAHYANDVVYFKERKIYDLRYHLLQLYSKRSHSIESIINPATHTSDLMDYRLSWLLLQTLEALGYNHCSTLSACQVHNSFASQLENHGLWEWAIFVMLHIKDQDQRERAVQNLIYRYVTVTPDTSLTPQENFIVNSLGVPEKWIDYAKSVKAGHKRQYHLQAKYLLKAQQWILAHEVIFKHIAPQAIINDQLNYLRDLLIQFECTDRETHVKVPNWANQGQIFLDFIDITDKFHQLKMIHNTKDVEARWENLKPQLSDLCSRINLLPCPTQKHRLCQIEIAENLSLLIRGVIVVFPTLNATAVMEIALERLPLPQEFSKKELQTLLDSLVVDISRATLDCIPLDTKRYSLQKVFEVQALN